MATPGNTDPSPGPATRWLVLGLLLAIALGAYLSRRESVPALPGLSDDRVETLAHFVLAAVLALVAVRLADRAAVRHPAIMGFGLVVIVTTAIEIAQISHRARSASVGDVLANLTGALLGTAIALAIQRLQPRTADWVVIAVMVVVIGGEIWAVRGTGHRWSRAPATVVDPLSGESCESMASSMDSEAPSPQRREGALAYTYDLSAAQIGGRELIAREAVGGPSLTANEPALLPPTQDGLLFGERGTAWLSSESAGRLLSNTIRENGTVYVEVGATPSRLTVGPARIVAISAGSSTNDVNVHLGQHGEELSVRLRLECGVFNWTRIDGIFAVGERRHIVVTFAERTQRIWVDGDLVDERVYVDDFATTSNWDRSMPLVVGNTPLGDRQFYGEIEFVTIGVARQEG